MFDLATADIFRDTDLIISVRRNHDEERLKLYLDTFEALGLQPHAYSDRGEYLQYLLVPDREELLERIHQSCRNSLGSISLGELKQVQGALPGELVS